METRDRSMTERLYRLTHYVPGSIKPPLQHKMAAKIFRDYMQERLGYFYVNVPEGPLPPDHVIMRTSVLTEGHVPSVLNDDNYFATGYLQMYRWLANLESCGFNIRTASTIMELGCGSCRLLRHLRCVDGIRLIGTDVEADKIEWCQKNIKGVEFYHHEYDPPIAQIEPNSVDLVYASSVFTHIPLATQDAWLGEMNRIIKPGGFLLASILGPKYVKVMLTPEQKQQVHDVGHFELTASDENVSISSKLTGQWDVFQRRTEVIQVYGKYFHIRDYMPSHQDLLILQKPLETSLATAPR